MNQEDKVCKVQVFNFRITSFATLKDTYHEDNRGLSTNGVTKPKYKLLHFLKTIIFTKLRKH